jgi:hypothetical protein
MAKDKGDQPEKIKSGLEDMDMQEFLEMCRREAPELTQIEEITPSKAVLTVYHNNSK